MEGNIVVPGDILPFGISGDGTYLKDGILRSSLFGKVVLATDQNGDNIINVETLQNKPPIIFVGDIVVAQVIRISLNQANVEIIAVGDITVTHNMKGVIRREDIRLSEVDKLVMHECFRPGDIVRASVVSLGDTRQYYLSTADINLGVTLAKSESGNIMIPVSWKVLIVMII